jgi:hypothetical protein
MKPAHTPGPWEVVPHERYPCFEVVCGPSFNLTYVIAASDIDWTGYRRRRADGRLIAAAPDLFDALEMVRDADEDCKRDGLPTIPPAARAKIDAALAKARGD